MTPFEKAVAALRDAGVFFSLDGALYVRRAPMTHLILERLTFWGEGDNLLDLDSKPSIS